MFIELWSEGRIMSRTRVVDESDFFDIASDKIHNAARKHGITIWF